MGWVSVVGPRGGGEERVAEEGSTDGDKEPITGSEAQIHEFGRQK